MVKENLNNIEDTELDLDALEDVSGGVARQTMSDSGLPIPNAVCHKCQVKVTPLRTEKRSGGFTIIWKCNKCGKELTNLEVDFK